MGKQSDAAPGSESKSYQCIVGVCVHNVWKNRMEWIMEQDGRVSRHSLCGLQMFGECK